MIYYKIPISCREYEVHSACQNSDISNSSVKVVLYLKVLGSVHYFSKQKKMTVRLLVCFIICNTTTELACSRGLMLILWQHLQTVYQLFYTTLIDRFIDFL